MLAAKCDREITPSSGKAIDKWLESFKNTGSCEAVREWKVTVSRLSVVQPFLEQLTIAGRLGLSGGLVRNLLEPLSFSCYQPKIFQMVKETDFARTQWFF